MASIPQTHNGNGIERVSELAGLKPALEALMFERDWLRQELATAREREQDYREQLAWFRRRLDQSEQRAEQVTERHEWVMSLPPLLDQSEQRHAQRQPEIEEEERKRLVDIKKLEADLRKLEREARGERSPEEQADFPRAAQLVTTSQPAVRAPRPKQRREQGTSRPSAVVRSAANGRGVRDIGVQKQIFAYLTTQPGPHSYQDIEAGLGMKNLGRTLGYLISVGGLVQVAPGVVQKRSWENPAHPE